MKKVFLALVSVLFLCPTLFAQEAAQEVTYVEDPSQGYLFNRMKDNWFITAEGGAGIYFSPNDSKRD